MLGYQTRSSKGFTIVELLIVIVIIGILATLVIVTFKNVRLKAEAANVVHGLRQTEKALKSYGIELGWAEWPIDNTVFPGSGGNPKIVEYFLTDPTFRTYMHQAITVDSTPSAYFHYDNDGDTKTNCTSITAGTNLVGVGFTKELITEVDRIVDDGNLSCGKVRYNNSNGYLHYMLSESSEIK